MEKKCPLHLRRTRNKFKKNTLVLTAITKDMFANDTIFCPLSLALSPVLFRLSKQAKTVTVLAERSATDDNKSVSQLVLPSVHNKSLQ